MTKMSKRCDRNHKPGDPCCELCKIADVNWTDEPTAVTKMLAAMRVSLAEAHDAIAEQREANESLRQEVVKHGGRQVRRSLTPREFAAGGTKP